MPSVLVTGANRGIGLEFCRQLKQKGVEVFACCRKASKELKELDVSIFEDMDVTNLSALKKLASQFSSQSLHLLINNAGILIEDTFRHFHYEGMLKQYEVNTLGPLKVVEAFLPILAPEAKIAIISSRAGSIGSKVQGESKYGYRMSKCALNMLFRCLSFDLLEKRISVALLHPGYVNTDMTQFQAKVSPQESVQGMLERIEELTLRTTGTFWNYLGDILPW